MTRRAQRPAPLLHDRPHIFGWRGSGSEMGGERVNDPDDLRLADYCDVKDAELRRATRSTARRSVSRATPALTEGMPQPPSPWDACPWVP